MLRRGVGPQADLMILVPLSELKLARLENPMQGRTYLSIVLAAGEGTRMRSAQPKVLHALAGRSLLAHVLTAVREAGGTATAVVVGPGHEAVAAEAKRVLPDAEIYVQ